MRSSALLVFVVLGGSLAACASAQDKATCYPLASWAAPVFQCGGGGGGGAGASETPQEVAAVTSPDAEPTKPEPAVKAVKSEPVAEPVPEPEPPAPKVELKRTKIELMEAVEFEGDSAVLAAHSKLILNDIARELADHPEVKKVQIEGHTGGGAPKRKNLKLSQERVAAVKAYLVSKGVEPKRLATKGFGDSKPLGSNKTEEGRAKNQRVEFRIVTRK